MSAHRRQVRGGASRYADAADDPGKQRRAIELIKVSDLISGALDLHALHSLSFHDASIVQAAVVSGCQRVLGEDLQHGATFGGVQVENPFMAQ